MPLPVPQNRHLGGFVFTPFSLFLFLWFFGNNFSTFFLYNAELPAASSSPVSQSLPDLPLAKAPNLLSIPNIEVSGELGIFSGTITAILPVLPETVDQVQDFLKPFLNPPDSIQFHGNNGQFRISHLIVLSPESSLGFVRRELQAAFMFLRPALDLDLDISLSPWALQFPVDESDEISLDIDVALLHAVSQLDLEEETMILLMDPTGLSSLSSSSVLSLLCPVPNLLLDPNSQVALPFGPYGVKPELYTPILSALEIGFSLDLQPAKYLYPPFIISYSVVTTFCNHLLLLESEDQIRDVGGVSANVWALLGSFISSFRNDSIGGLRVQPAMTTDFPGSSNEDTHNIPFPPSTTKKPLDFLFILPTLDDLHRASCLICHLLTNSTRPNLLVIVYTTSPPFEPQTEFEAVAWDSLVSESDPKCRIPYEKLTSSSYLTLSAWFFQHVSSPDAMLQIQILFTVKQYTPWLPFIISQSSDVFNSTTHISIPREDLPYTDWMASLTIAELKSWHIPHISLSVTTRNRPRSLHRLLNSLSAGLYFGDLSPSFSLEPNGLGGSQLISLRINVEQDCDQETLRIVRSFEWPPLRPESWYDIASNTSMNTNTGTKLQVNRQGSKSNLYIHHRIVHGGLLPAVVESWFPKDPLHDYGLLLEDDVEVSPLFYAWVKMCVLKYRYGDQSNISPHMFGISLYQQKHLELPIQGRKPFNPRSFFATLFSAGRLDAKPNTPYLSQIPCSWGAVYFPEHWEEFHSFLAYRLSEYSVIPISTPIVPAVRSNLWLSSWKRFFIELVYLRGYVMLYPNFEGFISLSTNHLEPGAHVKAPPLFNSATFVYPNNLNVTYDVDKEKEKRDLFRLPLMQLPLHPEKTTGLLRLPDNRLPLFNDLPILNLTGYLTSQKALQNQGEQRRQELFNCHGNFSHSAVLYSVLDLFCIADKD